MADRSSDLDMAPTPVADAYRQRVKSGGLTENERQLEIVAKLDRLVKRLGERRLARKTSALGWLFARKSPQEPPVRGLYIHGDVGRGKTMLMDIFYEAVPLKRKRRSHFNDFMAEIHDRIGAHRTALKNGEVKGDDPIPPVAAAVAEESRLICFDEFAVTDIADAMILSRLFTALFSSGVTLVATSNVAPSDLYRDGLNRPLFTPFIAVLEEHTEIVELDAGKDYRLDKLATLPVYNHPLNAESERSMDEAWSAAAEGTNLRTDTVIEVKGRSVKVPKAAGTAARFSFEALCEAPLGARDYQAIAERFDLIFIDGVPQMDIDQRNAAKRFILLIDTLYDKKARIRVSAEAAPDELYIARSGTESFEFARTASRLVEMQRQSWPD